MTKKGDPSFRAMFGPEGQIPVGKVKRLLAIYLKVKTGITSTAELNKKDRTWILLTALGYDEHLTLQNIDSSDESTAVGEDATSEDDAISEDDSNNLICII